MGGGGASRRVGVDGPGGVTGPAGVVMVADLALTPVDRLESLPVNLPDPRVGARSVATWSTIFLKRRRIPTTDASLPCRKTSNYASAQASIVQRFDGTTPMERRSNWMQIHGSAQCDRV